jgi:hypothetical protein
LRAIDWSGTVEGKIFIATFALVLITWLLYKLAEWLDPHK